MPDKKVIDLDNDPAGGPQTPHPISIATLIGEAPVEQATLDLECDSIGTVHQVNATNPFVVAQVYLGAEGALAVADEDLVHTRLKIALRRSESFRPFGGEFPHQRRTSSAAPA